MLRLTHYEFVSQVRVGTYAIDTHNDNERMLLDGKSARVHVECESTKWYSPARKLLPRTTDWEDKQLSHHISNGQRRLWFVASVWGLVSALGSRLAYVAESEELIETSEECDEHAQNNPCSDR